MNSEFIFQSLSWYQKTRLISSSTKILAILLYSFIFVLIISIKIKHDNYYQKPHHISRIKREATDKSCKNVCLTKSCIDAASSLLTKLDTSIDPCRDFYAFSCGNHASHSYIPNDRNNVHGLFDLMTKMRIKLKKMLLNENTSKAKISPSSEMRKQLFKSCVNYAFSDNKSIKGIQTWLAQNGIVDWPSNQDDFTLDPGILDKLLAKFSTLEANPFFKVEFTANIIPTLYEDYVLDTELVLPPEYLENHNLLRIKFKNQEWCRSGNLGRFREFLLGYFIASGINEYLSNRIIDEAIEFNNILENVSMTLEYDAEFEKINCTNVDNELHNRWCIIAKYQAEFANFDINFTSAVLELEDISWMNYINDFLSTYSHRKIVNYLSIWLLLNIMEEVEDLNKISNQIDLGCRFILHHLPRPNYMDREGNCITWISRIIPPLFNGPYIKENDILLYMEMANDILEKNNEALFSLFRDDPWINEEAVLELKKETYGIESYLLVKYFMNYYDYEDRLTKLIMNENDFILNAIEIKQFIQNDWIRNVQKNTTHFSFFKDNLYHVTAYSGRMIEVGFGLLQSPAFDFGRPASLNFGGVGTILGHELFHNIHDYFERRNLSEYNSWRSCIIDQYNNYKIPQKDVKVDGDNTWTENFGDIVGLQLAFKAYMKYLEDHGEEQSLPGVKFSNEQLFFISSSQIFCEFGDEEGYNLYVNHRYTPSVHRINGRIQNSQDFAAAFNCPLESPMNPAKKCFK